MTFVVVGAGPTGVEIAGQLAELSRRMLRGNFRRIDPADARIVLLDAAPTILPSFAESLQRRAARDLRRLGVEIQTGVKVTAVDEGGVDTDSDDPALRRIESVAKTWSAGVEASPLGRLVAEAAGVEVDRVGRGKVGADLTLPGHPEVFVIGDLIGRDNLPGTAQMALQSGRHVAKSIARRLAGDERERPFRFRDLGTMAVISRGRAIAAIGPFRLGGFVAWTLWLVVHLYRLTGFRNRVVTLADWTLAFLGRGRGERVITRQQVFAREALEDAS